MAENKIRRYEKVIDIVNEMRHLSSLHDLRPSEVAKYCDRLENAVNHEMCHGCQQACFNCVNQCEHAMHRTFLDGHGQCEYYQPSNRYREVGV